jgi:hypothetical protein
MCLSTFLVIREESKPELVLMGHLNPSAPWDHIGALDPARIEAHKKGWMLPSSHLIIRESPFDAAKRISEEQLELGDDEIKFSSEPKFFSDVSHPKNFPDLADHWDIGFIFTSSIPRSKLSRLPKAWTNLDFIDPSKTSAREFARSHNDVLEYAGFKVLR